MKCITPDKGCAILQDIHAGICGSHTGARSLMGKAYRQGFFWPTAMFDTDSLVHWCGGCQFFASQKHIPSHQLQTIPITWPFSTWGLDLVGPFKKAKVDSHTSLWRWISSQNDQSKVCRLNHSNQGGGIHQ
jgi:hypothetical protein